MVAKRKIVPGGIDEYIEKCPADVQKKLTQIRSIIRRVAPEATETVSYFQLPGYHCEGEYPYNGMFAWFSYKAPYIRLHVYPEVIKSNAKSLEKYTKGAGVINFPQDDDIENELVKKLVEESMETMKDKAKK